MENYSYENHALANDNLAIYVLMAETDYGDEWYREIAGISYDKKCLEDIIPEHKSGPYASEETKYVIHRVEQMTDELHQSAFKPSERIKDECYIVFQGPALEMTEKVLGYFAERQHSIYYAEIAASFEGTDEIIIMKAPMDTLIDLACVETASAEDGFEFE